MLKIINKTPHSVTVAGYTVEPDAEPARCTAQTVQVGDLAGIPLFQTSYGDVYGLPPEREDTVYIVSEITAQAVRGKRRTVGRISSRSTTARKSNSAMGCMRTESGNQFQFQSAKGK